MGKEHEFSKPVMIDLSQVKCEPTADFQNDEGWSTKRGWTIRCSLTGPDGEKMPLFVYVFMNKSNRLEAEIESDQTDYAKPDWPYSIKRASIKNLKFWK